MSRSLAFALGALLAVAARTPAQSRRDLEAQVAQLIARVRALDSARTVYADSMIKVDSRLERFDVGPLHLRTTPALHSLAAQAATMARADLEGDLGAASYRLSSLTFFVRPDQAAEADGRHDLVSVGMIGVGDREDWADDYQRKVEEIARGIEERAMHELTLRADLQFRRWSWGPIPLAKMTARDWVMVRLKVVAQSNDTSAACYEGDIKACRVGLQVDGAVFGAQRNTLLQSIPISVRPSLVAKALEMGGDGAMERLLTTRGSAAQVLSATAGAPVDDVIKAWTTSMRETRVASATMNLSLASTSLLLILGCAGASLRSSRWR